MSTSQQILQTVGYSAHGQKIVLVGDLDATGKFTWAIRKDAARLTDNVTMVDGLDSAAIQRIADLVRESGR